MGAIRTLVDELRRRGATVHEWSGWDGRGNEGVAQIDPKGAIIHHTATAYGSAFPDLVSSTQPWARGNALCNVSGNADGSFTVLASGIGWHAGQGAGPSLGKLAPWRNRLNYYSVGLEIVYPGDKPMTDAQYRSALLFAKTVADLFGGGDIECIRAHAETNGRGGDGKWDPGYADGKTIDMTVFRREAAAILEDELANSDEILAGINNILSCLMFGGDSTRQTGKDGPAQGIDGSSLLGRTNDIQWALTNALPTLMGAVKSGVKVDPEAFRALISGAVNDAVGPAVRDAIGDENAEKVNEIAEAVKSKLATALAGGAA